MFICIVRKQNITSSEERVSLGATQLIDAPLWLIICRLPTFLHFSSFLVGVEISWLHPFVFLPLLPQVLYMPILAMNLFASYCKLFSSIVGRNMNFSLFSQYIFIRFFVIPTILQCPCFPLSHSVWYQKIYGKTVKEAKETGMCKNAEHIPLRLTKKDRTNTASTLPASPSPR